MNRKQKLKYIRNKLWNKRNVFIWNILKYLEDKNIIDFKECTIYPYLLKIWWKKDQRLYKQCDICVNFIFNLLKDYDKFKKM